MTNMEELLRAANAVSGKNDHWLFIATLLLFFVAVFFALRWLVGKHEKLMDLSREDQKQYSTTILNLTAEQNKTAKDLAVVLDRCACSLEENSTELRLCREQHKH